MADPSKRLTIEQLAQHPWMQIKEHGANEVKEYFDSCYSNESSYTTADSEGEGKAREVINSYQDRVRGGIAGDDSDEE